MFTELGRRDLPREHLKGNWKKNERCEREENGCGVKEH